MKELIRCLTLTLKAINSFLECSEVTTIKARLNYLLKEGSFGTRFNKCRFKKCMIPFLKVKGLYCKELKLVVLVGSRNKEQEKICRARRVAIIYVKDKHSIKQLDTLLVENELI